MAQLPSMGRVVRYRSRTGNYSCAAIVTATQDDLFRPNVDAGYIADLSSPTHVHLTVLTPGKPGKRAEAADFLTESAYGRSENVSGTYQEMDIAYDADGGPGTWSWPLVTPQPSMDLRSVYVETDS